MAMPASSETFIPLKPSEPSAFMMNDYRNIESSLGFSELRQQLIQGCHTPVGIEHAQSDLFLTNVEAIEKELALTAEMMYLHIHQGGIPAIGFNDIRPALQMLNTPGLPADTETVQIVYFILETSAHLHQIFRANENQTPLLAQLASEQNLRQDVRKYIEAILNEQGEISDSASPALATIRKTIAAQRRKMEKNLASMLKDLKEKGVVDDDVSLSLRNGRLTIPVAASRKQMIRGVVLDESSTGQTVYIEPIEIFELNNEVQDLEYEERREIHRILVELANFIRPALPDVNSLIAFLGRIDFIRAKASMAVHQRAVIPSLSAKGVMLLMQARHPLLEDALKRQGKSIVPLDLELHKEQRIMVISGPNAGGKSVAMKTAGLLQYMFQCGFPIPAAEGTQLFPFKKILAAIGDQQSIENDLSTYSSHLISLKKFLEEGNHETLILIDEFGSGTEPESGGAIAKAVLERLHQQEIYGIVTTHYFNLKTLAAQCQHMVNAAMLFDDKQLKPLYRLSVGKPGSSFALEMAATIGLPSDIIQLAGNDLGQGRLDVEKMVQDLEKEKMVLDDRRRKLSMGEDFVAELIERYTKLNASLQEKRSAIMTKASNEAAAMLDKANALIEKTIREIKQQQAEKSEVKKIRNQFLQQSEMITKTVQPPVEKLPLKKSDQPRLNDEKPYTQGEWVRLESSIEPGEIIAVKGKRIKVQFSQVTLTVDADRIVRVQSPAHKHTTSQKVKLQVAKTESSFALDLRGKRSEEAIQELDRFLDQALINGVRNFSILHGKGYGILRTMIRKHLSGYKDMLEYSDAMHEAGGEGVTEVRFL